MFRRIVVFHGVALAEIGDDIGFTRPIAFVDIIIFYILCAGSKGKQCGKQRKKSFHSFWYKGYYTIIKNSFRTVMRLKSPTLP